VAANTLGGIRDRTGLAAIEGECGLRSVDEHAQAGQVRPAADFELIVADGEDVLARFGAADGRIVRAEVDGGAKAEAQPALAGEKAVGDVDGVLAVDEE